MFGFEGYDPLVIENKMFSVPRGDQLADYSKVIDNDRSLGPNTPRALLSPCLPARPLDGWLYISYPELADRLRDVQDMFDDAYVAETVGWYAAMVERISGVLWSTRWTSPTRRVPG